MSTSDILKDDDKYICSIRSTVRGRAELILTDITNSQSTVVPLRWRQLLMLSYEALKSLDAWPLTDARQSHPFAASTSNDEIQALGDPSSP